MSDREIRFKLTLHYDGSAFHGWQVQPGQPTVQGALEAAVSRIAGRSPTVEGAGRTDTGVHATGQTAAVTLPAEWRSAELVRALNALLPDTVWVRSAEPVAAGFHPRFDAVSRSYSYRVGTAAHAASPFHRRWCWPLCRPLDLETASALAQAIVGEHEFHAFAKAGQPQRGYACNVTAAAWRPWEDLGAVFEVSSNRFLHRMVRYLVGTMTDVALGRRDEGDLVRMLESEKGDSALTTSPPAPPQGLFLTGVEYPDAAASEVNVKRTLHNVI